MNFESEQKRLEGLSENYRKDANKIISELPRHLILTSTVFIALSSSIIGINDISLKLSTFDKWLLICSLGLMVLSIFIGFIQYIVDYHFFKEQMNSKERIINEISKDKFSNFEEYKSFIDQESKKIKMGSSNFPLITQSIFIFVGITFFTIVIYNIFF